MRSIDGNTPSSSTIPSDLSSKSRKGFRKASIGLVVPLPKRVKLLTPPKGPNPDSCEKQGARNQTSENHKGDEQISVKPDEHCDLMNKFLSPPIPKSFGHNWETVFVSQNSEPVTVQSAIFPAHEDKLTSIYSGAKQFGLSTRELTELPDHKKQPEISNQEQAAPRSEPPQEKQSITGAREKVTSHKAGKSSGLKLNTDHNQTPVSRGRRCRIMPGVSTSENEKEQRHLLRGRIEKLPEVGSSTHATFSSFKNSRGQCDTGSRRAIPTDFAKIKPSNSAPHQNAAGKHQDEVPRDEMQQKEGSKPESCNLIEKNAQDSTQRDPQRRVFNSQSEKQDWTSTPENTTQLEMNRTDKLRNTIRNILEEAKSSIPSDSSQKEKQKTFVSDPIETDSEYNNQASKPINLVDTEKENKLCKPERRENKKADSETNMVSVGILKERKYIIEQKKVDNGGKNASFAQKNVFQVKSSRDCKSEKPYLATNRRRRETQMETLEDIMTKKGPTDSPTIDAYDKFAPVTSPFDCEKEPNLVYLKPPHDDIINKEVDNANIDITRNAYSLLDNVDATIGDKTQEFGQEPGSRLNKIRISRLGRQKESQSRLRHSRPTLGEENNDEMEQDDAYEGLAMKEKILPENANQPGVAFGYSSVNEAMKLLSILVQKLKRKVKTQSKSKLSNILASTSELIQRKIQEVEMQIHTDVDEFVTLSKRKFGQLQTQLKEEHDKLKNSNERFKREFLHHLNLFNEVASQVEATQTELKGLADKQKLAHRRLLTKTQELTEKHLTQAEQKLRAVQKAAKSMEGFRDLIKRALQDD